MLLVLALLWGAFIAYWLRGHAQTSFGDSVGSFRRDLHVLERTAPATMRAANRLRGPQTRHAPARAMQARVTQARVGQGRPGQRTVAARRIPSQTAPQLRRRQTAKRRRDVLFGLTVVVLATLVMAVATRSHALMALQLLADAALGGYVALLVRLRNLAAEREIKLSYMARPRATTARRRYPDELAYADLALRRTAN